MFRPDRGDRPNVPNYLVVLTDGKSNQPDETWREAMTARDQGIITTIGIGGGEGCRGLGQVQLQTVILLRNSECGSLSQTHLVKEELSSYHGPAESVSEEELLRKPGDDAQMCGPQKRHCRCANQSLQTSVIVDKVVNVSVLRISDPNGNSYFFLIQLQKFVANASVGKQCSFFAVLRFLPTCESKSLCNFLSDWTSPELVPWFLFAHPTVFVFQHNLCAIILVGTCASATDQQQC